MNSLMQFAVNSVNAKPSRKKGTKEKAQVNLSQEAFDRMQKNPKFKYIGKRNSGKVIPFQGKLSKDNQELEENIKSLDIKMKSLNKLTEGYKYMGGVYVKITKKEVRYIVPQGLHGDLFRRWKLFHWSQIIKLSTELN